MKKILSFLLATAMLFSALNIAVQAEEPVGLPIMDTFDNEPLEGWTFNGTGGTQTVADSRLTLTKNGTNAEYSAQREIDKNGVDGTYYMEINFQAMVTLSGFNIYLLNGSGETVIPVLIHSAGRDQKPGSGNDGRIIMNAYDTEKEADVELDLAEFTKDQEHVLGIKMDTQQKKYWAYLDGNLLCSAEGLSMPQQTPEKEYKISQVKFVLANNCKSGDALVLDTFSLTQWTQIDEQLNQAKEALVATNLTQEDPMAVTEDLTLPESGLNGTKISWTSDRTDLIGNDGKINLANILSLSQSTAVTMTATISLDGKSVTKSFVFYVQKYRMEQVFADVFQPEADIPDGWTGNGTNAKQEMTSMGRLRVTATGDKNAEYTVTRELGNALTGVYQIDMTVNTNPHNDSVWFGVNDSTGSELVRGRIHASGISTNAAGNKGRVLVNHFDAGQSKMTEVVAAELTKGTDHILSIRIDTTQKKFWMMLDGATIMPSGVETDGLYYANPEQERENNNLQTFYIQLSKTRTNDYVELAKFSLKKCIPLEAQDVDALLLEAKNALKISDLTQDDPSNLQHDLTLPATGQNETVITWLSNNQNLISDQGVLNQEEVAKLTKAVQVVMTATFSLGGKTAQQKYTFTIKPPAKPGDDEEKLIFHDTFEENDDGWVFTGGNSTKKVEGGKLTITSSGSSGFVASRTIEEKGGVGIFDLEAKLQSYTTTAEFWLNFYNANGDIVIRTRLHASGTSTPGSGNYTRLLVTGYNEENQKETEQLAGEFTKNAQHTVRFKIDTDLERIWTYIDGKQAGPADGFRFAGTGTATEFNIARFTVETGGCASGNYIAIDDLSCKKILTTINKLREAADAMLVSNLTDGDPSNLKQDLTLAEQGLYDTTVTWQSSQPQLIGNDGRLNLEEIANLQTSMPVDMTATFSLFGQSITKIYHFVLPANENEGWYTGVQEQFGTDVLNALWVRAAAENIIRLEQGTLLLRRVNTLPGMQAKRWLVEEGKAIGKTTVVEADITATAGAKMECLSLDEKTALRVLVRDGEQQPELVIQTGSAQDVAIPYTAGYTARIRALIDPQGGTVTVMVNGETVVNDAPLLETTHNLAAVSFSIPEESHGEMTIDNFSVFVRMEEAPQIILDSAGLETLFAGDYLYDNVILPQELLWNGKAVWKSSAPDIISDTGVISFTTEEQQAELTVHVYAGEDTQNYAEQVFPVRIAPYRGENLALGKAISSKASSASGKILTNLNDGDMDTMWMTAKYEENPSFTITLDSAAAEEDLDFVNTFMLLQANNAVKQYLIETSVDGTTWEEAVRSGTFGTVKTMPRQARYIRYTVLEKEQGNSGLIEFQVFFSPTDSQRAAADAKLLKLAAKSPISGNISLPEIGKYGSAITWESSRPDVVGNQGQFTNPQAQVQFVLTATVTSGTATVEKSFPFYTKAPSSGGTGGGGGGGRPASGGGSGTGVALPPVGGGQTTPTTFVYFKDVPQGHWAKDFIDALYEQKVISGYDGSFEPDNSVTREEFVKMIINALGIKPVPGTLPFKDVHNEDWFAPYVAAGLFASDIYDDYLGPLTHPIDGYHETWIVNVDVYIDTGEEDHRSIPLQADHTESAPDGKSWRGAEGTLCSAYTCKGKIDPQWNHWSPASGIGGIVRIKGQ